jgi:predicted nucleotidyltransferase
MELTETIQHVVRAIRKFLPDEHWKILLFGSWAKGTSQTSSDLDIGIMGPEAVPWYTMVKILEEIETIPTLRSIDIVDLRSTDERFRSVVLPTAKAVE